MGAPSKDHLSESNRSAHMSKIRSKGNQSTELRVETAMRGISLAGWEKHPKEIVGTPDFFFPRAKLAVFVNGCFWHGCAKCCRNVPQNRREFWLAKLEQNRKRDRRVLRQLRRLGFRTVTVWEHSLKTDHWLSRICRALDLDAHDHA
jgi:DNA mismatch endonuclease, patch repair protein